MDNLNTIISILKNHQIFNYPGLIFQIHDKTEKYTSSKGIKFESSDFAGEIFHYANGSMEHYEIEFLIYRNENSEFLIIENLKKAELNKSISEFLTERLNLIKNVANHKLK